MGTLKSHEDASTTTRTWDGTLPPHLNWLRDADDVFSELNAARQRALLRGTKWYRLREMVRWSTRLTIVQWSMPRSSSSTEIHPTCDSSDGKSESTSWSSWNLEPLLLHDRIVHQILQRESKRDRRYPFGIATRHNVVRLYREYVQIEKRLLRIRYVSLYCTANVSEGMADFHGLHDKQAHTILKSWQVHLNCTDSWHRSANGISGHNHNPIQFSPCCVS